MSILAAIPPLGFAQCASASKGGEEMGKEEQTDSEKGEDGG